MATDNITHDPKGCGHTHLFAYDIVRGPCQVIPCPYCERDRLRAALKDIASHLDESYRPGCLERILGDKARAALSGEPSAHETGTEPMLTLNGYQLKNALEFCAPDDDLDQLDTYVTIQYGDGHSGKGYYVSLSEYPDEGSILLDHKPGQPPEKAKEGQS